MTSGYETRASWGQERGKKFAGCTDGREVSIAQHKQEENNKTERMKIQERESMTERGSLIGKKDTRSRA